MHFQVLTIFPELFDPFARLGLLGRAVQSGLLSLETTHLREYAINTQGQIDDTPYGGGSGMVLRPEPAAAAIRDARSRFPGASVVLLSPRGRPLTPTVAKELAGEASKSLILLCCRYEGIDERIVDSFVDHEISVGDYVLMGGEVAAMALMEAVTRFVPGVLGNPDSITSESFESGLLEYPQYTKPREFEGKAVPEVLLSGNHREIDSWRAEAARRVTAERRPELLLQVPLEQPPLAGELNVALIHYPVVNKEGKVVTSSITNLDLHDIARSARTFGLSRYYLVHPSKTLRRLMHKICEHWFEGYGLEYNPNRSDALQTVSLVPDFDDVLMDIESRTGMLPRIITTSAKQAPGVSTFEEVRRLLFSDPRPHLLLLGTGWGMADELMERADIRLEPINGFTGYNHLSVRAAAAIMFDRLLGNRRS
ncbi:MAG: tRNA (guanosine(37)-N1)-methyltransferase TrmD [Bdellovibrionales bacterium]|nr:tRNA (guanosine(37)-N1)-methyltransferase TrmD [Bdellovibrionales bacterium]